VSLIETERLKLRKIEDDDWALYQILYSNEDILAHVGPSVSEDVLKKYFSVNKDDTKQNKQYTLIIEEKQSGVSVGSIGMYKIQHTFQRCEIGFMLLPDSWGKGYATEAAKAVVKYAFNELGLNRISAVSAITNIASHKVLEKVGFEREGCLRQNVILKDEYVDDYIFGMLKNEFIV
jgi:[ribosomal protein S5]-alanine N-acetyltransferase